MARSRGQLLVELALTLPFLMLLLLGAVDAGFLIGAMFHQGRATAVVADWAAGHPGESWNSVSSRELTGCDVNVSSPSRDLVEARATCQHHSIFLPILSVPISSSESAAVSRATTPAASPSSSSTPSPAEPSASGSLP